jgi:glycosyltransferase involved in cell wall biosynthesis
MPRVGIDYTAAVQQRAGIGRYVRELVAALLRQDVQLDYRLFAASPAPLPDLPFRVRHLPFHDRWLMRVWHRVRAPLPVELITGPIDIYHSPDFTLPPTLPRTRTLLTVHDLSFVRDPDSAAHSLRTFLSVVVPRSVERADRVLADSQATKEDLIELWATPEDKVSVLYCGVDSRFRPVTDPAALAAVRARYGLSRGPFVLSVSTLQPRKNFRRLIQAFAPLAERHPELSLVIGGGKGWRYEEILAEPERVGIAGRVLFPGFVDDSDLPALYSAAVALAYPSLYEGFGLPVLEAMACGTPVIASDRSSLPEVTADAGLQADPFDVEAWTAGLAMLVEDTELRESLVTRGLEQAGRFSWDRAASELLHIYRGLL